jgi:AsmA protein
VKKVLIGLAVLVVLVIAAAVIVPFFIPVETYKGQIAQQVRNATGRELAINGAVSLSLLPRLELEVNDVAFSNAPGGRAPEMAALSELRVRLELLPLLSREIQIDSFVLVDPVIHLEVDKDGRPNWEFEGMEAPEAADRPEAGKRAAEAKGQAGLAEIRLGDVRLVNGTVTYFDATSDESLELSDINVKVSLPDLDSPFEAEGDVVWNAEKVELEVGAEKPRELLSGGSTAVAIAVESEPIQLDYKGSLSTAEPLKAEGELELEIPSVRGLAAWAGKPLEMEGSGLGLLSVKGKVGVNGKQYSFSGAKIALDSMTADGEVMADLGRPRPYLKARLDVDKLDLNTYLPPQAAPPETADKASARPEQAGPPPEWSDEPIDVSGLRAADADLSLSAGEILVQEMKIGHSALSITLKDGKLTADLTELALYDGAATGRLVVDGSGEIPGVEKKFKLSGVQAEPFLRDAADLERLTGTADGDVAISAKGRSQRDMVQALNGTGSIKFSDGAIKGINLGAMVRNVKSAFLDKGAREAQKTDFAELSGTFQIQNGILRNDDLKLLNPLLRLSGAGTADLPQRTVNYRVEPKAVATTKGQGGEADLTGVTVPVIIEGPWHDLSFRPDLAGMVGEALKDPSKALEGAKETVKGLKEGAVGTVEGVFEGVTKPEPPGAEEAEEEGGLPLPDAGEALKGLFGK